MAKKISIITPCFNAESLVADTIESVLNQTALASGRAELEYVICDGASRDGTLSVIDRYRHPGLTVISEPDSGMYDALAKGLRRASGEIVAYLNAGDLYNRHAFDVVLDVFEQREVKWLTGCMVLYNERSQITFMRLPFRYRQALFACGIYGKWLPTVQQESTFWSAELHRLVDFDRLAQLKYAGDFYLWSRFATATELTIVETHLGGFKLHQGQISENRRDYDLEVVSLSREPTLHEYALALLDRVLLVAPPRLKKALNRDYLLRYDHDQQSWR